MTSKSAFQVRIVRLGGGVLVWVLGLEPYIFDGKGDDYDTEMIRIWSKESGVYDEPALWEQLMEEYERSAPVQSPRRWKEI